MSYLVYYHFADSFSDPIICPKGTFEKIKSHLRALENELGFKYEYDESGAMRWASIEPSQEISDEVYCAAAIRHNAFVRKSYHFKAAKR